MSNSNWSSSIRLAGLRRFAVAITVLNILGHTVLGFEQSIAQPLVALAATYGAELLFELLEAGRSNRRPAFLGGFGGVVDFLLSAHITGLAIAMLLYANDRLMPVIFAALVAIASKSLIRVPAVNGTRHLFNPSNFGITLTLLAFPWVGIAPPYHFTEYLDGAADWILPWVIVISGTIINTRFTKKLPLIAAWLGGFIAQAFLRSVMLDTPFVAGLVPMTGVAFILFTFYMITDPATTPFKTTSQVAFGLSVAASYGMLMLAHVVFGLFFALSFVCLLRGLGIFATSFAAHRIKARITPHTPPQIASAKTEV